DGVVARSVLEGRERGELPLRKPGAQNREDEVLPGPQAVGEGNRERYRLDPGARVRQSLGEAVEAGAYVAAERQQVTSLVEQGRHPQAGHVADLGAVIKIQTPAGRDLRKRAGGDLE